MPTKLASYKERQSKTRKTPRDSNLTNKRPTIAEGRKLFPLETCKSRVCNKRDNEII